METHTHTVERRRKGDEWTRREVPERLSSKVVPRCGSFTTLSARHDKVPVRSRGFVSCHKQLQRGSRSVRGRSFHFRSRSDLASSALSPAFSPSFARPSGNGPHRNVVHALSLYVLRPSLPFVCQHGAGPFAPASSAYT
jgi:hypothetical protein